MTFAGMTSGALGDVAEAGRCSELGPSGARRLEDRYDGEAVTAVATPYGLRPMRTQAEFPKSLTWRVQLFWSA